ncbi:MAG: condensation domain-containing protein, partial [Bacteroidota bacterium]
YDNFFELGGHSLLAMRVIAGIRREMNYRLRIKNFFETPSIAGLAKTILKLDSSAVLPEIRVNRAPLERIPLSFAQERLWFIDQLGGSREYHISSVLQLENNVNKTWLAKALSLLVDRHQTLRSVIRITEGETYQEIISSADWKLQSTELKERTSDDHLQAFLQAEINRPFDLANDFMLRAHLVRRGTEEAYLLLVVHHIASDGWSQSILVKDFTEIYNALDAGQVPQLSEIPIQYTDYAIWQRKYMSGKVLTNQLNWWEEALQGIEPLRLPTDFSRPAFRSTKGAAFVFQIEPELTQSVKTLAQRSDVTLFMTLMAVFKILMYRYSYQQTICVGTPAANRSYKEIEEIVGYFINTLVFKSDISGNLSFAAFLESVKTTTLSVFANQEVPFERIVEKVEKERDESRTPVFQVMFALQNMPASHALKLGEANAQHLATEHTTAQYDLTFSAKELNDRIVVDVEYSTDLFLDTTAKRMAQHFKNLLKAVVSHPEQNIAQLPMLSPNEERQLLFEFNDTKWDFPKHETVLDLFKQQVLNGGDQVALLAHDQTLSYKALHERSNQLANYLLQQETLSSGLIGICMDRSV